MNPLPVPELQFNDETKTREQLLTELTALRQANARLSLLAARQQETAKKLRSSEERFNHVIRAISDHIYVTEVTPEGDYLNLYLSPHIETLTGYPPETFLHNWNFWPGHIIHPEDRGLAASQTARLAIGQDSEVEYRLIRADGQVIWVYDRGQVQVNAARSSKIIYGVVSDITERKRLENRLVAIYQLGQELHLLRDEKTILKRVLKTVAKILQSESSGRRQIEKQSGKKPSVQQLFPTAPDKTGFSLRLNQQGDVASIVIHHGQPHHIGRVINSGLPLASDRPRRSQLSVPMKVSERVIGVLNIESHQAQRFTPSDRQILQILADQTATSIENSRLYNETRQRVEELAAMSMIGQAIISTLDLQETLTVITDHATRLLNVGTAVIALYDKNRDDLWFAAASGENADLVRGRRLPVDQGVVGWVVRHGEPALIPDAAQAAHFFSDPEAAHSQPRSVLSVPLQTGSQTIGAIELRNKKKRPFDQKDMRLLGWLAMPAATAIENARLYEDQRQAREQAETLREATSTLTSTLNLNNLLENILTHLEQVIPYDNAYVFLRENMWLTVVAGRGAAFNQPHSGDSLRRPADDPLYQQIQATGHPLILSNVKSDPRFQMGDEIVSIRAWMGVPLMVRSEVIGYLTLDSRRAGAYGQTEANLAQAFANQAAVAIQNARLFEQVHISHKRLQSLSRRLVHRQESERRHIARELHDEAGQALTTLRVGLHLLEQEAHDPEAVVSRVTKLKRMAESVLENLHRLAMDLRPASLEHLGLVAALEQFVETFGEQRRLALQLETVNLGGERLPLTVETSLYRIVQEALTNVGRHARASRADVFLKRRDNQIIMIIEDDGVGFDIDDTHHSSRLGLVGMRERAEMLGGRLVIESEISNGTTVYVEVPYVNSDSDR